MLRMGGDVMTRAAVAGLWTLQQAVVCTPLLLLLLPPPAVAGRGVHTTALPAAAAASTSSQTTSVTAAGVVAVTGGGWGSSSRQRYSHRCLLLLLLPPPATTTKQAAVMRNVYKHLSDHRQTNKLYLIYLGGLPSLISTWAVLPTNTKLLNIRKLDNFCRIFFLYILKTYCILIHRTYE